MIMVMDFESVTRFHPLSIDSLNHLIMVIPIAYDDDYDDDDVVMMFAGDVDVVVVVGKCPANDCRHYLDYCSIDDRINRYFRSSVV